MGTKSDLPKKYEKISIDIVEQLFKHKFSKFNFKRTGGVGYTLDVELM